MLTINILPDRIKKVISIKKTSKIITKFSVFLLILIMFMTSIIFMGKLFLKSYLKTVDDSVSMNKKSKNFGDDITKIENDLKDTTIVQKEHINYLNILEDIILNIDNDISISQIRIDGVKNEIIITGYTNNRNSLIVLKNKFEESDTYSNIDLPLDNLLEKTNINFNIKMNFKIQ